MTRYLPLTSDARL